MSLLSSSARSRSVLFLFGLTFSLIGLSTRDARAQQTAERPIRALLITGGCCHDYDRQKMIIPKGLSQRADIEWTVIQQGGSSTASEIPLYRDPNWAEGFDVVVHNECFADAKDPAWLDRVLKPHREGTPAVVIHCAMHCYRAGNNDWFEFCGVRSHGHGPHYSFTIENLAAENQVMTGFGQQWSVPKGELYHIEEIYPSATPLAHAKRQSDGEPQLCIWTNDYHGTRVFGTTVGHYNETMAQPTYLNMLARGVLWAARGDKAPELRPTTLEQDQEILALVNASVEKANPQQLNNPCCGEGNLLLNQSATASSEETGKQNFAKHAVDGLLNTRWCANGGSTGEWLQIDLGAPKDFQSLRIHWEQNNAAYRYAVKGSSDEKSWMSLVDASNNQEKQRIVSHDVSAKQIRFLRVEFLGASSGGWGSLWEIEAYNGPLPELPASVTNRAPPAASIADVKAPSGFETRLFAAPPAVNYPVCITTSASGEVFVGVDEQGSLGKKPGGGRVLRCVDVDGDGQADQVNTFAVMDHPRGLVYDQGNLWVLHPPFLTLFQDTDGDGQSDQEKRLITGISTDQVGERGADHTTNGIRMGIDGWIYIAVGDFGFNDAVGADGKRLSRRGGGIVRVQPDGSDMEIFSWGQRNILDVCIDPRLNMFTRDNTNDGGGWNVRVSHIQRGADYGYPSKYINYTDETMPPLADYGGGSGCGAMYVYEPRWPAEYQDAAYTCDWGTSVVYRHRLNESAATYEPHQDNFLQLPRPTDIDIDASGRMYVTSWKNGGFNFSDENVGFVVQVMPQDFLPKPFPDVTQLTDLALVELLSDGASARTLPVQREFLRRGASHRRIDYLTTLAEDANKPLPGRIAALFTIKQLQGVDSHDWLTTLVASDPSLREYALRALTDRSTELASVPDDIFVSALSDKNPRVQAQALIGLRQLAIAKQITSPEKVTQAVLVLSKIGNDTSETVSPHDKADTGRVLPHLAMGTLVALEQPEVLLTAIGGPLQEGALRALRNMHTPATVTALISKLDQTTSPQQQAVLIDVLARLYYREGDYINGDWWGTRPDNSGPYYDRQTWSDSSRIAAVLSPANLPGNQEVAYAMKAAADRYKLKLDGVAVPSKSMDEAVVNKPIEIPKADPNNPNQIGNLLADVVRQRTLAHKGNASNGKQFFQSQSCATCHTDAAGQTPKGPHLVDIGKRYTAAELVESIINPSAKLAQGFETWTFATVDGFVETGFVVSESAETVVLRRNDGVAVEIVQDDIEVRKKQEQSMMPNGVVDNLTPQQLADLIAYLQSLKSDN